MNTSAIKNQLINVLLNPRDEDASLLDELSKLINKQPNESRQYKVLSNLYCYLKYVQDNDIDMLEDIVKESSSYMLAASLRAVGFIGDTARDENIAALILHSAENAWVIKREIDKSPVH